MMGTCVHCECTVVRWNRRDMPDGWVHYHTGDVDCMFGFKTLAKPSPDGTAWIGYLGSEKEATYEAWNGGVGAPGLSRSSCKGISGIRRWVWNLRRIYGEFVGIPSVRE